MFQVPDEGAIRTFRARPGGRLEHGMFQRRRRAEDAPQKHRGSEVASRKQPRQLDRRLTDSRDDAGTAGPPTVVAAGGRGHQKRYAYTGRMEWARAHPGLVSILGGVVFGVVLLAIGARSVDAVGVVLAVAVAGVFAVSMYVTARRGGSRSR